MGMSLVELCEWVVTLLVNAYRLTIERTILIEDACLNLDIGWLEHSTVPFVCG